MNKFRQIISNFFFIIIICSFILAIGTTIFVPRVFNIYGLYRNDASLLKIQVINISCLITAVIFFIAVRYINKKGFQLSDNKLRLILIAEGLVYILVFNLFIRYFQVSHLMDDAAFVFQSAIHLETHSQLDTTYMYNNPQNLLLLYIYRLIIMMAGNNIYFLMNVFLVFFLITVLMMYLILREYRVNNVNLLISLQLLFFAMQLFLHIAVAYTDILSLLFLSVSLLFFIKYLNKATPVFLILASFFALMAFLSKGTALIYIIAIVVYLAIMEVGRKKLSVFIPIIVCIAGVMSWSGFISSQHLYPDDNYGMPNTHYLMMGASNSKISNKLSTEQQAKIIVGGYSGADYRYSSYLFNQKKLSKKEVSRKQLTVLKKRLTSLTPTELFKFVLLKISSTWSTGDLKATTNFGAELKSGPNKLSQISSGKKGFLLYY